jgi:hypothetical protein
MRVAAADRMRRGRDVRKGLGLLSIDECVDRFGLDRAKLLDEIETGTVGAITYKFPDGDTVTLVPTRNCGFPQWIEASR